MGGEGIGALYRDLFNIQFGPNMRNLWDSALTMKSHLLDLYGDTFKKSSTIQSVFANLFHYRKFKSISTHLHVQHTSPHSLSARARGRPTFNPNSTLCSCVRTIDNIDYVRLRLRLRSLYYLCTYVRVRVS